jgi:hypothetical protein
MATRRNTDDELASSGHSLGQKVGDWLEQHFVLPLLSEVADQLRLFLDHRFRDRVARAGNKIIWKDEYDNEVDYDFVMELDGTDDHIGIPVGFFECFWRRGKRHSKDKARDDSGKLRPMRDAYPTARFLGIIAGGDFTGPASALVQRNEIDLFCIPKAKIIASFQQNGVQIDYPDRLPEQQKAALMRAFDSAMTDAARKHIATTLCGLIGQTSISTYVDRVRAALGALPQELRFIAQHRSRPVVFESISEAAAFLKAPIFDFGLPEESYIYEITYSDGTEFERAVRNLDDLRKLHHDIERLAQHVASLLKKRRRR